MKLGAVIVSFVPRLLVAVPVFVVVVCAAMCAGLIEILSPLRASRPMPMPMDVDLTSSCDRG